MPTTASRYTGLSVPDMDWLCLPFSMSSNPVHHLLSMFTRRSRSSGLKLLMFFMGWGRLRNGTSEERITFALSALDLV